MVLDLILIGLAITLEPIPLTAFILVLASKNGRRKGAGFIFGWLLSLAVVVAVTILATGNNPPRSNTAPSLASLAVKIAIGVVLVVIAVRRWRKIGEPKPPKKTPKSLGVCPADAPCFGAVGTGREQPSRSDPPGTVAVPPRPGRVAIGWLCVQTPVVASIRPALIASVRAR
jgi:hypothetical protein